MLRPCFLVVDRETSTGISTRKLIIETAKFNVITAYSSEEAIQTLRKFPAIDGIVADASLPDMPCEQLLAALKKIDPSIPVVVVCTPANDTCALADHTVDTFNPSELLDLLQRLHPEAARQIEARNEELEQSHFSQHLESSKTTDTPT